MGAEVVDEDFAVDLGGVEEGAALPEEFGFFALAFDEEVDFAADPFGFLAGADFLLELHQLAAAGFDGALGDFECGGEVEGLGAFFVGVAEDAEPVDFGGLDEVAEVVEVGFGFAGEADDEAGADDDAGDDAAGLLDELEEDVARCRRASCVLSSGGAGVLQRDVEILGDVVVLRHGFEQARGDLVGIGVEEAQPAEAGEAGEGFEQLGEAVGEAEVFAVAGGVLADEGDLADALRDEVLRFGDDASRCGGSGTCRGAAG